MPQLADMGPLNPGLEPGVTFAEPKPGTPWEKMTPRERAYMCCGSWMPVGSLLLAACVIEMTGPDVWAGDTVETSEGTWADGEFHPRSEIDAQA